MQKLFREVAQNEVKENAADVDENERFPKESVEVMRQAKMLGIPYSREYGGAGADYLCYILAIEELSKTCATSGVVLSAHTSLGTWPIAQFGTEEQKQRFLTDLCTGKKLAAFGLTEPNAGTDAAGQQTTAVLDGDEYVINGTKIFITNAGEADVYVIFAMTDKTKGTRGISAFILEKGTPGFTFGLHEKKLGIRGSATCELIFNNVRIPKENLLGKEGMGFKIAMQTLDETFRTALTGDSKEYRESSSSLMFAFILAIVLIYLILAAQFESFKDPLIIMLTVPLAIAGALVFMYFGDITMNIFSQIGIIMLIGLVAKNGILIVEFANQKQEAGEDKMRAIKDASLQRLRPILMTSASTILGLIPLAYATGEGCNQRIAMGTAVVGGMLISTLLTMYIVPAIYSYVSTNRSKLKTE